MKILKEPVVFIIVLLATALIGFGTPAAAEMISLTGTISEAPQGLVLEDGEKTIVLAGTIPEELVGLEVTITGDLEKDDQGFWVLTVETIE